MGQNGTGIGRGRFGGGAKLGGLAGLAASTVAQGWLVACCPLVPALVAWLKEVRGCKIIRSEKLGNEHISRAGPQLV